MERSFVRFPASAVSKRLATVTFAWLIGAVLTIGFVEPAAAEVVAPPTMSGEAIHDPIPTLTSPVVCSPDQPPYQIAGTFEADGTATGPYPGTFRETGNVKVIIVEGHVTSTQLDIVFTSNPPRA